MKKLRYVLPGKETVQEMYNNLDRGLISASKVVWYWLKEDPFLGMGKILSNDWDSMLRMADQGDTSCQELMIIWTDLSREMLKVYKDAGREIQNTQEDG